MAVTFQQLLDRAEELATNIAGDAQTSPLIDSEVTAEVIYPHAVRSVFRDYAKTGRHLDDMQMNHSISLTGDSGTLPDNVIRECLDHAYIPRDQFASKVPYEDYQRYRFDNQMCYFAIKGGSLYYSCWSDLMATGTWYFAQNPVEGETIVVNGVTFTFRAQGLVMSGSGEASVNATWTYRGNTLNDKKIYNKLGEATTTTAGATYSTEWSSSLWNINGSSAGMFFSGEDVTYPYQVVTWTDPGFPFVTVPTVVIRTFSSVEVEIGDTIADTVDNFAAALSASSNASIIVASYASATAIRGGGNYVTGTYLTAGSAGNAFTMAASSAGSVSVSGATFTGGGALTINTPGIPTAPTAGSDALTFSPAIIDDIVMKIASVLRGELKLNALIGNNDVRK